MLTVLPFQNNIELLEVKGVTLRKVLEKSVGLLSVDGESDGGGFLQVSGKFNNLYVIGSVQDLLNS